MRIIKVLFILFLLFNSSLTYSYNERQLDSLYNFLPQLPDTLKVKVYLRQFVLNQPRIEKAESFIKEAITLSKKINYSYGEALSLQYYGKLYLNKQEYAKALETLYSSIQTFKQTNRFEDAALSYLYIGFIFIFFKNEEEALRYTDIGKSLLYKNFSISKGTEIDALIENYYKLKKYDLALEAFNRQRNFHIQHKTGVHNPFQNLVAANIYKELKDFEKAIFLNKECLDILNKENRKNGTIYNYATNNLGVIFGDQGNIDSAITYLNLSLEKAKENNYKIWELINYRDLAELYLKYNNYAKAKHYGMIYFSESKLYGFRDDLKKSYQVLAEINIGLKNYLEAYNFILEYSKISDSLLKDENFVMLKNVIYKKELEEAVKTKTDLEIENKRKDDIIKEKQSLQLGLIIISLIVFVFALISITLLIKYRFINRLMIKKSEELNEKNQQLEYQNALLERLNAEKEGLIGIVSHDLKSPLNRVEGLVNLVDLSGESNEDQKNYLELAKKELKDTKELIQKILDNEIKETGEIKSNFEKVLLKKFFNDFIQLYSVLANEKHIKIIPEIRVADNCSIYTDKNSLIRILDNLLSNAIKFSGFNRNVYITVGEENGLIDISIKDEGPGFTPDDLQNLFKKYKKLSAVPTGGESSTGIGLHIVKKLVDKLGGEIRVETTTGVGTNFKINFQKT